MRPTSALFLAAAFLLLAGGIGTACGRSNVSPHKSGVSVSAAVPATTQSQAPAKPTAVPQPPYEVGGAVTEPVVVSQVPLHFSGRSAPHHFRGVFVFETVIDETGTPRSIKTLQSPTNPDSGSIAAYEDAAKTAIAQWRYRPGTLHGRPVPVRIRITISFRLSNAAAAVSSKAQGSSQRRGLTRRAADSRRFAPLAADAHGYAAAIQRPACINVLGSYGCSHTVQPLPADLGVAVRSTFLVLAFTPTAFNARRPTSHNGLREAPRGGS